jgi:HSP20 family molecular chaperone IbpA
MKRATKSAAKLVVLHNNDPISEETEELQSRIRDRAYQLSQERGHAGREVDDWLTAESEIISVPPAELIERDGMFEMKFAVGGLDAQDVRVLTSPDRVLVRCEARHECESQSGTVHLCDFKSLTVFRSVPFPERIDVNRVDLAFEDGVLRITAAKQSADQSEAQAEPRRTAARRAPARKKRAS